MSSIEISMKPLWKSDIYIYDVEDVQIGLRWTYIR